MGIGSAYPLSEREVFMGTLSNQNAKCTRKGWLVVILGFLAYCNYSINLNMLGLGMLNMREDLGLTIAQGGLLTASSMLGSVIGPILFGMLAANKGNRFGEITAILTSAIASIFTAVIPSFYGLMVVRFIVGLGVGGMMGPVLAEVAKHWSPEWRGRATAWACCAYQAGSMFTSMVATWLLPNWRALYYMPIIFGVIVVILIFFLWPKADVPGYMVEPAQAPVAKTDAPKVKLSEILVGPVLMVTIMGILCSGMNMGAAFGMGAWIPSWLQVDHGLEASVMANFNTYNYAAGVVGYLVWSYVAAKAGSVKTTAITFAGTALAMVAYLMVSGETLLVLMGPVVYFFQGGIGATTAILFSEMYPARLRALGSGTAYGVARVFSAIGPYTLALLATSFGYTAALWVTPVIFALGLIFTLILGKFVVRYQRSPEWGEETAG